MTSRRGFDRGSIRFNRRPVQNQPQARHRLFRTAHHFVGQGRMRKSFLETNAQALRIFPLQSNKNQCRATLYADRF
jgi:predicted nuclease of restriction endonuclease-like RecB superfamily